ncbi:MAG TPA: class I SAM-dependent rRNA methyltransferase [Armatimonadota bacterium]|nr:class I SAM-dependent rRNA methyltransferase [Armatimonadota bacterium]HOS43655.1 class I SAM-dependent rRNA methyltransferase [Armatimonadota bacterium]
MSPTPTVIIDARGAKRLKQGHLWVYASDVADTREAKGGDIVALQDERGHPYGYAFFSDASQITLRWCAPAGPPPDRAFWKARLEAAAAYRARVVRDTNAYRLVYSEGDLIPSLIIDRYDDHCVLQTLSQGTEALKSLWVELLRELFSPRSIVERNDTPVRQHENLPQSSGTLDGTTPAEVTVRMHGVELGMALLGGHKTGAFLDQRENYLAAAGYAHGRLLDAFTFAGGFALHMAPKVEEILAVDISEDACALARRNAARNKVKTMDVIRANVFDFLRELDRVGERFDTIVLDPPAFAKSKSALPTAYRGYKEINLRAMRLLAPGGTLVTCSCSYHVSEQLFLEMLADAMTDVGRPIRIIEQRLQARDHPVLLGVPETKYLKCVIARVLA